MKLNKQSKRGFTLVELMVSMVVLALLSLTIGSVLIFTWTGWHRASDSVAMQRDASLAMRMIAKEIRASDSDDIEVGNYLKCSNATFSRSGDDLTYKGMNVVDGWLDGFRSTATATNVTVQLSLKSSHDDAIITATFYTRN